MIVRKFTGLLKSHAIKQGLVVLVDQGMMSVVTFVTGVLIARTSTKEEYALYMLGWTLLISIKGIQEALVNLPFTIYAPRLKYSAFKVYQGSAFIHTLIFCFIFGAIMLLAFFINDKEIFGSNFELVEMTPFILFLLSSFMFRDFLRNALLANLKVWESVRINGFVSFLLIITVAVLFHFERLSSSNAYLLFAVAFGVAALVMFWLDRFQFEIDRNLLWPHWFQVILSMAYSILFGLRIGGRILRMLGVGIGSGAYFAWFRCIYSSKNVP
jgi:O-antigen/teichoic acid export membrane protein